MSRCLVLVVAIGLIACASAPPCPPCAACPVCAACESAHEQTPLNEQKWFILNVKDGDTLVARLEGADVERKETVRLLNINTPEKSQPGFDEATEALKALVRGGTATFEYENPLAEKRDGFGRLLAYVIADGVNVNVEMTRQGWSKLYTKYGKGRLHEQFVAAETEARAAKRGLWGMEADSGTAP